MRPRDKKVREKEIKRLQRDMPDKKQDGQEYYTRKARIEQLKFEMRLRESEEDFARLHWFDASKHYSAAKNHLKWRTEAEAQATKVWLARIKQGENPTPLDINFISSGNRQYQHSSPPKNGFEINSVAGGNGAQAGYRINF